MENNLHQYYILANSFAAPIFSDESDQFIEAENPVAALNAFVEQYDHPAGLYVAVCYYDANAYANREKPLAKWYCNHLQEKIRLSGDGSCVYYGHAPGDFEIDGVRHIIDDPKGGSVVEL